MPIFHERFLGVWIGIYLFYEDWSTEAFRKIQKNGLFVPPSKREDEIVSDVDGYGLKAIIEKTYSAVCQP